jgi:hypothetical protein
MAMATTMDTRRIMATVVMVMAMVAATSYASGYGPVTAGVCGPFKSATDIPLRAGASYAATALRA